jgi:hypothetical protein
VLVAAVAGGATLYATSGKGSAACESGAVRAPRSEPQVPDNTLVWDGTRYGLETAGALFPITVAQAAVVPHLGATRQFSPAVFDRLDRRPRLESVLTEEGSGKPLYFSTGGAVFPTTRAALARFRPNAAPPVVVPAGSLNAAPRSPRSGSLVEMEGSGTPIWLIRHGIRQLISPDRLCALAEIIRVPASAGVLAEIPLHAASTARRSPPSRRNAVTPPPTLPDPFAGLVANECRRRGDAVVASGNFTNIASRHLWFVVHVRLLAADGTELGKQDSGPLDLQPKETAGWYVPMPPPAADARIDRCEYRVEEFVTAPVPG